MTGVQQQACQVSRLSQVAELANYEDGNKGGMIATGDSVCTGPSEWLSTQEHLSHKPDGLSAPWHSRVMANLDCQSDTLGKTEPQLKT